MNLQRLYNIADLRSAARKRLPRVIFEFVDGGAQDEITLRANSADFARYAFRPRMLTDISERSTATTILGAPAAFPVVLAPTGLAGITHRRGELPASRAAAAAGVPYCLSCMSTCSIEDIAAASSVTRWFQLYVLRDRELTRTFIERAKAAGCRALVLTVDTKVQGPRERDMRNGFTVPPRFSLDTIVDFALHWRWLLDVALGPRVTYGNFAGSALSTHEAMTITRFIGGQFDPSVSYKDLEWFKNAWGGPVAVKGILTGADARAAVDHGADAIIVSNHGGRQLDGAMSSIRALPEVADAVGDRAEVILDGGVRRGSDIVKALCLGARACMIGRAWLYGLAAAGEPGVARSLEILRHEFDLAVALLGRTGVDQLDRSCLAPA